MANFEDWCDSTERNISDHYLQSIKARDAEFMFGVQVMAALIPEHYASSRNIANAFEALGKPGLAAYIAGKLPETKQIRSGDLGEIFATEWINTRGNGYKTPIKRLRWKDHRNMSMRGEDVIGIYIDQSSQQLFFLKTEAKSRAKMTGEVVSEARDNLNKEQGLPSSHALMFIADRLNEQGEELLAKAILNATLRQGIVPGCVRHLIFLLSGNSSETMLTTSIEKYTGQNNQWGVCLRIARHGEFIAATFEKVISDASNS